MPALVRVAGPSRPSREVRKVPFCMARAVRCKTEAPRPTNVRAATMYQASNVEHLLRAIMGIRAHPRLTSGKTSLGHHGTQSLGCAGQTVRPSLHADLGGKAVDTKLLSLGSDV